MSQVMSGLMNPRTRLGRWTARGTVLTSVSAVATVAFAGIALACHPEISASIDCSGTVAFTATAWAGDTTDPATLDKERTNPSIGVGWAAGSGATVTDFTAATGSFSKSDSYSFSGTFTVPHAIAGETITVADKALGTWGNGDASHAVTTTAVTVASDCGSNDNPSPHEGNINACPTGEPQLLAVDSNKSGSGNGITVTDSAPGGIDQLAVTLPTGKTFTGDIYVKGGDAYNDYSYPGAPLTGLIPPINNGGQHPTISHYLICGTLTPTTPPTLNKGTLTTTADGTADVNTSFHDVAHLTGLTSTAKGTVTFALYSGTDASCSSTPVATSSKPVSGNGDYASADYKATTAGTYHWVASYSGDSANEPLTGKCGDPGETTVVSAAPTTCSENSFFLGQTPAADATVTPGETLSVIFSDETPLNTTTLPPVLTVDGVTQPTSALTITPLATTPPGGEKYSDTLSYVVPASLGDGATHTISIKAYDSDQNKAGGDCGTATWTVKVTPTTQSLSGEIYDCTSGTPTTALIPAGSFQYDGTDGATDLGSYAASTPSFTASVHAGSWTVTAFPGSGYHLVSCGSYSGTSSQTVTVPAGGSKDVVFYAAKNPTVQSITGVIYLCASGQPTTTVPTVPSGDSVGTVEILAGQTVVKSGDAPQTASVQPGDYTVAGLTPPAGYSFTACGNPTDTSTGTITVGPGESKTGAVYVTPVIAPPTQSITGVIYLCGTDGQPTTTVPSGTPGTVEILSGTTAVASGAAPQTASVAPGGYTVEGLTAPTGYSFVACGNPSATQTGTITVNPGQDATGAVYVTPVVTPPTQSITGVIYLCAAGQPTTTVPTLPSGGTAGTVEILSGQTVVASGTAPQTASVQPGGYTVEGLTAPSGYAFTACGNPTDTSTGTITVGPGESKTGAVYVTPVVVPPTQSITGVIYLCGTDGQPTTTVPSGAPGTVEILSGQTVVATGASPQTATVAPGTYTVQGLTAPTGYAFTACGNPTDSSTGPITVGTGEDKTGAVYVTPVAPPVTQSLTGVIYLCGTDGQPTTSVPVVADGGSAGTVELLHGSTVVDSGTPPVTDAVAAGDYTVKGLTAPTGYAFTACGNPSSTSTGTITVNPGQDKTGAVYVTPVAPPATQTITGVIYLCGTDGQPTTSYPTVATGASPGTVEVLQGSTVVTSGDSPVSASVPTGDYTVKGLTAPVGYSFVACGNPSPTQTGTITVGTGEDKTGAVYVTPNTPPTTQSITGVIYLCGTDGQPTTSVPPVASTGTVEILSDGTLVKAGDSPVTDSVPAGTYTVKGVTAPTGYEFVACGNPSATETGPVQVPAGGSATGAVYVTALPAPTTQSITGVIYLCGTNGQPTTSFPVLTDGANPGTVDILSGGSVVTGGASPVSDSVPVGDYTVKGITAPAGYEFVACTNPSTNQTGTIHVGPGEDKTGAVYVEPIPTSPDLTITKSGPKTGVLGGSGSYLLTVTNQGTGADTEATITVTDVLPAGESYSSAHPATGDGWSCQYDGVSTLTCTHAGDLAAGDSLPSITVPVTYTATGSLVDTATVTQPSNDSDTTNGTAKATTVVGAPDVTVVKGGPRTGVVGGHGSYTLTVSNQGTATDADATITVTDVLPAGESYDAATGASGTGWACGFDASTSTLTCTHAGNLAAGDTLPVITVPVTYTATGSLTDTATVSQPSNDSDTTNGTSSVTTTVTAPVLQVVKTGPASGEVGQTGTYTITASNVGDGPDTASVITVTDTLPAGESFVSASGAGWSCSALGQVVTCTTAGPLAAGDSLPAISVKVLWTATGSLTDTATVSTPPGDTQTPPTSTVTTTVTAPDLTIVKTGPASGTVNHDGSYVLLVTNQGDGADTDGLITVTDTLPAGEVFDSASGTGWTCVGSPQSQTVTCTTSGPLAAGAQLPVITVTVTYTETGQFTDTATVTQPSNDTDTTNGTSSATTTVTAESPGDSPDLAIVKTGLEKTVSAGGVLDYTLVVSNVGSGATTGPVVVTDSVPAALTITSVTGDGWDCGISGQDITCTWTGGVVAPGATLPSIVVDTKATSAVTGTVINTATVTTPNDTNPGNNTSTAKTPVLQVLPVHVTKPPTTTPPTLAFTGADTQSWVLVALALLGLGGLLVLTARRRRTA